MPPTLVAHLVVAVVACAASGLTLFSGFGLGTLLMPVIALFFPVPVAIGVTAVVHLLNNLFKLGLLGRHARWPVVLRFGLPAMVAAFLGALTLGWLDALRPLARYELFGRGFELRPVGFVIGLLILAFVVVELGQVGKRGSFSPRWLPLGGAISGFFGGLSGNQGAFRSAFLIQLGLDKESFVATGVTIAVLVDLARLAIYGTGALREAGGVEPSLVIVATLAAFAGAYAGRRLLRKLTLGAVRTCVSILLVAIGLGMIAGWL